MYIRESPSTEYCRQCNDVTSQTRLRSINDTTGIHEQGNQSVNKTTNVWRLRQEFVNQRWGFAQSCCSARQKPWTEGPGLLQLLIRKSLVAGLASNLFSRLGACWLSRFCKFDSRMHCPIRCQLQSRAHVWKTCMRLSCTEWPSKLIFQLCPAELWTSWKSITRWQGHRQPWKMISSCYWNRLNLICFLHWIDILVFRALIRQARGQRPIVAHVQLLQRSNQLLI